MQFIKYDSIENIDNTKLVEKAFFEGKTAPGIPWIAQEKIHGTNFSFICDGVDVVCAKRTNLIGESEAFFGYELILKRYKQNILDMFNTVKESMPDLELLTVFGEYAGPGIQREVDYEEKDFWVFDILINGDLVDALFLRMLSSKTNLKICPVILTGDFDELSNLERSFDSLIPEFNAIVKEHGIPAANAHVFGPQKEGSENIAEGYVLKPITPTQFNNKSRVIFKCKNAKFKETGKVKTIRPTPELSNDDQELVNFSTSYITAQRLSNVISHVGEISSKDFGKVQGLMMQDVLKDMLKAGHDILDYDDPALIKKSIQKEIQEFIRKDWVNLITK
ncbi:RNA ligase [Proteus phage phiP4-3]|uniref:RNA ligase 2 n=1 Tax=Proteus phage phiP4-3 TaxID=2065203 RepID=A0A2I6PFF3_9CAUD|nr:RNA ligase [Proteus phage phiP4-3]AUM58455.1 RNA ligase 2 [Proteus phage phiP4-3]